MPMCFFAGEQGKGVGGVVGDFSATFQTDLTLKRPDIFVCKCICIHENVRQSEEQTLKRSQKKFFENGTYYCSFNKSCDGCFPDTSWRTKRKHNYLPFILLVSYQKKTNFDQLSFQICVVLVNLVVLVFAIIYQTLIPRSIKQNNK